MEDYLLNYCSPSLAGVKVANLINIKADRLDDFDNQLATWRKNLKPFGIFLELLRSTPTSRLIYVYRKSDLEALLSRKDIREFLESQGYKSFSVPYILSKVKYGLKNCKDSFPHEIGIFLGYPLADVVGYINNKGQGPIKTGLWRVYENPEEADRLFKSYQACKSHFLRLHNDGYSVLEILKNHKVGGLCQI